jgi:hypothetical protein
VRAHRGLSRGGGSAWRVRRQAGWQRSNWKGWQLAALHAIGRRPVLNEQLAEPSLPRADCASRQLHALSAPQDQLSLRPSRCRRLHLVPNDAHAESQFVVERDHPPQVVER